MSRLRRRDKILFTSFTYPPCGADGELRDKEHAISSRLGKSVQGYPATQMNVVWVTWEYLQTQAGQPMRWGKKKVSSKDINLYPLKYQKTPFLTKQWSYLCQNFGESFIRKISSAFEKWWPLCPTLFACLKFYVSKYIMLFHALLNPLIQKFLVDM